MRLLFIELLILQEFIYLQQNCIKSMKKAYDYSRQVGITPQTDKLKPKTPLKTFAKTGKESSPVLSEHAIEASIWEEVLEAMLKQTSGQIQDRISRIPNKEIKTKFTQLNDNYIDLKVRKGNLERKIASLNDFLFKLTENKLIKLDVKLLNDDIKQIDIESLRNVVKITNEAKVMVTLLETNGDEPKLEQYSLKAYVPSLTFVNKLKGVIAVSNQHRKMGRIALEQQHFASRPIQIQLIHPNESLKKQLDQLQQTIVQLEKDKEHLRRMLGQLDPKQKQSSKQKGLEVTKRMANDYKLSIEQLEAKSSQLSQQNVQLKEINAKMTKDLQLLNEMTSRYQAEIERLKIEEKKQKTNFMMEIEKYKQEITSIRQNQNSLQIKYNTSNNLYNQAQNLRKELAEKESLLKQLIKGKDKMEHEKEQWQRTIQAEMNKSERLLNKSDVLQLSEKAHKQKMYRLESQLLGLKAKNGQLDQDKISIQLKLKNAIEDKEIEIDNNTKQRQQYQVKIRNLQIENKRVTKQLKEANYLKDSAAAKCQQYQRQKLLAEKQIKELITACNQIQDAKKNQQEKIRNLSTENGQLLEKIKTLQSQNKSQILLHKDQTLAWRIQQDLAKRLISQRQAEISSLRTDNERHNSQIQKVKGMLKTLEDQLQQKQKIIKGLKKEQIEISDNYTDLQNSSSILNGQLKKVQKVVQTKQEQLSQLKNQLYLQSIQRQSTGSALKDQYEQLKNLFSNLKREKADTEATLNDTITSLRHQLSEKDVALRKSEENVNAIINEKEQLRLENEESFKKKVVFQSQIAKQIDKNQEQYIQFDGLRSENTQLKKDIDVLRQAKKTLNEQLINSNQETSKLNQQNTSLKFQANLKEIEIEKLKNQLESQSLQLIENQNRQKSIQANKQQLEKEKKDSENSSIKRIEQLEKELQSLHSQYENVKRQLEDERNQNISLTQQIQLTQQHFKNTEAKKNVIESQLADIKMKMTKEQYVNDSISVIQLGQSADPIANTQNVDICNITEQIKRQEELDETKKELEIYKQKLADEEDRTNELQRQKEFLQKQREDHIKQLESNIDRLSSENADLKANIQTLKVEQERISKLEEEKKSVQRQRDAIKETKETMEKELEKCIGQMSEQTYKFQANLHQKQKQCNEFEGSVRAKGVLLEAAQKQVEQKAIVIEQMLRRQTEFDEKQKSYIDKQLARVSETRSQDNQMAQIKKQNEQLQKKIQQKQSEIALIKERSEQAHKYYQSQAEEDQKVKESLKKSIENFKQKVANVESELDKLKMNKQSLTQTLVKEQQKNEQNKAIIERFNHELSERQAKITQIQNEYKQKIALKQEQLQRIIQNHENQIRNYEQRLREVSQNVKQKEDNFNSIARIKDLQLRIDQLASQNTEYEKTLNIVRAELTLSQKHTLDLIEQKDKEINRLKQEARKLNGDFEILSDKNKELDKLFDQLTIRNEELEREKQQIIQKGRESQEKFGDMMNFSLQDNDDKIKRLEDDAARLSITNADLKADLQKSQKERLRLQGKNKKYQEQIDELTHQIEILNQTLEDVNKFNMSMEAKCDERQKQAEIEALAGSMLASRAREVSEKQIEIAELKDYVHNIEEQLIKKQSLNGELQLKIGRLQKVEDELDFSDAQLNRLKLKQKEYLQTLSLKQGQLEILSEEKQRLKAEQEQYMKLSQQDLQKKEHRLHNLQQELILRDNDKEGTLRGLFQHELLEYQPTYKQFLKESIQQECNGRILKSRLIYRYDPINKVNFHLYIDNQENIVVIIKLANGHFIAGFTEDSLQSDKRQSQKTGLIMSLTNREVFTLAEQNKRAATYDEYYIIFGNSEIRIKSQEKRVFSNFGISNSYFKSRGHKVETLLGGSPKENQVDFESFEIYQLGMIYDF